MMKRKRENEESSLNNMNDDCADGDKSTPEIVDIRPLETMIEFEYQIKVFNHYLNRIVNVVAKYS